jgi:roadblock/LC7 domain-containing protein
MADRMPWEDDEPSVNGKEQMPWEDDELPSPKNPPRLPTSKEVGVSAISALPKAYTYLTNVIRGGAGQLAGAKGSSIAEALLNAKEQPEYSKVLQHMGMSELGKPFELKRPVTQPWAQQIPRSPVEDITGRDIVGGAISYVADPLTLIAGPVAKLAKAGAPGNIQIADLMLNPLSKTARGAGSKVFKYGIRDAAQRAEQAGAPDLAKIMLEGGAYDADSLAALANKINARATARVTLADEEALRTGARANMLNVIQHMQKKAEQLASTGNPLSAKKAKKLGKEMRAIVEGMTPRAGYTPVRPVITEEPALDWRNIKFERGETIPSVEGALPSHIKFEKTRAAEALSDAERNILTPQTFKTQVKAAEAKGWREEEARFVEEMLKSKLGQEKGAAEAAAQAKDYSELQSILSGLYPLEKSEMRESRKQLMGKLTGAAAAVDPKAAAAMIAAQYGNKWAPKIGYGMYKAGDFAPTVKGVQFPISQLGDALVRRALLEKFSTEENK